MSPLRTDEGRAAEEHGLDRSPTQDLGTTPGSSARVSDVHVGRVVGGRYRIVRLLARGGMAAVYEAVHTTTSHRVALKLLYAHYAEHPTTMARFMNEARAAATLRHPHIARCEDAGVTEDGIPFLVLELLEGRDLARELESEGRLPLERACEIARQIAGALMEAHAAGIVHRDLKPENVFLSRTPDGGYSIKLLDFGIARFTTELHRQRTRTGAAMGTPLYMAPEQFRDASRVDTRADIYALGVVLYEMLTGRLPFEAESMPELIARISTGEFTPITELRADVPRHIARAIERALAPNVDKRTESVQLFLDELAGERALDPLAGSSGWRRVIVVLGALATAAGLAWLLVRESAAAPELPNLQPSAALPAQLETAPPIAVPVAVEPRAPEPPPASAPPPSLAPDKPASRSSARRARLQPTVEERSSSILDEPDF